MSVWVCVCVLCVSVCCTCVILALTPGQICLYRICLQSNSLHEFDTRTVDITITTMQ